jgi:hypothetical protein
MLSLICIMLAMGSFMNTPCMGFPCTEAASRLSGLPMGVLLSSPTQLLRAVGLVSAAAAAAAAAATPAVLATGVAGAAAAPIAHVCSSRDTTATAGPSVRSSQDHSAEVNLVMHACMPLLSGIMCTSSQQRRYACNLSSLSCDISAAASDA